MTGQVCFAEFQTYQTVCIQNQLKSTRKMMASFFLRMLK